MLLAAAICLQRGTSFVAHRAMQTWLTSRQSRPRASSVGILFVFLCISLLLWLLLLLVAAAVVIIAAVDVVVFAVVLVLVVVVVVVVVM